MKHSIFLKAGLITLPVALTQGCRSGSGSPPPADFTPVGEGLTATAIVIVWFSGVHVLGSLSGSCTP